MRESFHIHEDLWGGVTLSPIENLSQFKEVRSQLSDHDREHWTGAGWDELFVLPEEQHPLIKRNIAYEDLFAHFQPVFQVLPLVVDGYALPDSVKVTGDFAMHYPAFGTFYGSYRKLDGIVTGLHFAEEEDLSLNEDVLNLLHTFGKRHELMLVDWYLREYADLADLEATRAYFQGA